MSAAVFSWPVRVYYEDTDAGGVVYHANYLKFMERARSEWIRDLGFCLEQVSAELGVVFVVRSANLEYLRPARLSEMLRVEVSMAAVGRASLTMDQVVRTEGGQACVTGTIGLVCVDAITFRPAALPQQIRDAFNQYGEDVR